MFGISTNVKRLAKKVLSKQRKDWNDRLKQCVKAAEKYAENGNRYMAIQESLIKCPYNMNRSKEDIIKDFKKAFKGCEVNYIMTVDNKMNVEIKW